MAVSPVQLNLVRPAQSVEHETLNLRGTERAERRGEENSNPHTHAADRKGKSKDILSVWPSAPPTAVYRSTGKEVLLGIILTVEEGFNACFPT